MTRHPFLEMVLGGALLVGSPTAFAADDLRLPRLIGDHMVIQQGRPVVIHGWADPGSRVDVAFGGAAAHGRTDLGPAESRDSAMLVPRQLGKLRNFVESPPSTIESLVLNTSDAACANRVQ